MMGNGIEELKRGVEMTERAKKIRDGKRQRALMQLKSRKRDEEGFFFMADRDAMTLAKWIDELQAAQWPKVAAAETEGDGKNMWWYACGECHGIIVRTDRYCRHCGCQIDWSGFENETA